MAEALTPVPDPLEMVLVPGPAAPAELVCRALARSVAPRERDVAAPRWLQPEQVAPYRRALAALERYGGAMLADPVGSGKTWIALAVAAALDPGGTTVAVVPAALVGQWRATAVEIGVAITVHSHEALSRGRLPGAPRGLVIVDEAHRFRNPATRRYATLARWLVGGGALLLSATPVVNRLEDLAHQLLLAVRDDALVARGCSSLVTALRAGAAPEALGDLVLCRAAPAAMPVAVSRRVTLPLTRTERELLGGLELLRLSPDAGVAALLRVVFWRALASSPGAFAGTLARYRRLLHHARAAGRPVTRAAIRSFTGADPEQLLLWEMLPGVDGAADLCLEDATALAALEARARLAAAALDARSAVLRAVLADGATSIVFTASRDSLGWLRDRLADLRPAWVSGDAAGIGTTRMSRESVLRLFRPAAVEAGAATGPAAAMNGGGHSKLLLATDVASEGLDLQRAERIVHYDLPWTSVRLDQRAGRALRLGARGESVEILAFAPAPELEALLHQHVRLTEKRRLGVTAGIESDGRWLYRWRGDLALEWNEGTAVEGMAVVPGDEAGWLVGFAFDRVLAEGTVVRAPATLLWLSDDDGLTEDPSVCVARLLALRDRTGHPPSTGERAAAVLRIAPIVRSRLRLAYGDDWRVHATEERDRLARRLRRLAALAARDRDRPRLALVSRALVWLAGGLSAGELLLAGDLLTAPDERLLGELPRLLLRPRASGTLLPRLTGIVRVTSFPACQPSEPCSSISTAR